MEGRGQGGRAGKRQREGEGGAERVEEREGLRRGVTERRMEGNKEGKGVGGKVEKWRGWDQV